MASPAPETAPLPADTPMPTGSTSTEKETTVVDGGVAVSDSNPHVVDSAFTTADQKLAEDGVDTTTPEGSQRMCTLYRDILNQQLTQSRWGPDAVPGPVFKNLYARLSPAQQQNFDICNIDTKKIDCEAHPEVDGCETNTDVCSCDNGQDKCNALPPAAELGNAMDAGISRGDAKTYARTCSESECCDCDYCNVMLEVDMGDGTGTTSRRRLQDTMPAKKSVHGTFGNFDESEKLADGVHDELTKLMSKDFNHDGKLSLPEYEAYFAESQTVAHYMEGLYNNVPLPRARVLGDTETTDSYNLIMFVGGWSAILTIVLCFLLRKLNQLTSQLK